MEEPTFFNCHVMVKVSPGANMVPSGMDWDTHSARSLVATTGVPRGNVTVRLAEALTSRVGVEVVVLVGVRLGIGVAEGVNARSRVTCASTVAAASVRIGFESKVGMLVGVGVLQAAKPSKLRNTPITSTVLSLCVI